jgi:hypothetical protein
VDAKLLAIALACLVLSCGGAQNDFNMSFPPSPERHATRAAHAGAAIKPLGLLEPIELVSAGMTRDAYYYVELRDADGVRVHVSQVARRRDRDRGFRLGEMTLRTVMGTEISVETGSDLEAAIYGLLIRWSESHPMNYAIQVDNATNDDRVLYFGNAFLNVTDWRFAPSLSVRAIQ